MRLEKVNKTFQKLLGFGSSSSSPTKPAVVTYNLSGYGKILSDLRISLSNSLKMRLPSISLGNVADRRRSKSNPSEFHLLGPPEIYLSASPEKQEKAAASPGEEEKSDPFMDSMVSNFNNTVRSTPTSWSSSPRPYMGYTENRSPTFLSSGNHCLDFFFHVVPDTPRNELIQRLKLAWEQDPLTALKLVCNLRGVRGTGKSDTDGFYNAAFWLHENHPKTLATNAKALVKFGYYKDLPEILDQLLKGHGVKEAMREQQRQHQQKWALLPNEEKKKHKKKSSAEREKERIDAGRKGIERHKNDPNYRFLHDQVSIIFAEQLKSDLSNLNCGKRDISLAAKWCPSLYSTYDRSTLLCEAIARRIFPKDEYPEYLDIEDAHYAYRVRDRLRKEVLVPLRKEMKLPEVYMSANEWGLLPYNRVASVAMKTYKDAFLRHDKERFEAYLGDVKQGKKKIAAGALYPHQIISTLRYGQKDEVAELQWQRIVNDLSEKGSLKNCLAICDVSGSMAGEPLDVSVALGLLVSELSEEPWKGKLITFSRHPQLHIIKGDSMSEKICFIDRMYWELNTDFQAVFDKILETAKSGNLWEDQLIKRLFVFSDMEFDQASANDWETDYEAITRKFHEHGYSSVPEIVFWNLRNSKATPVPSHQKGVALVSGFSKNLLNLFLENGGALNPETTMLKAISGDEYGELVVVD